VKAVHGAAPIYLLRHGETEWNTLRRIQGHKDSPLTALGERQATAMGNLLADLIADRHAIDIVASPLGRTRQTATIVAHALGLEPERLRFDDRLKEMSWGLYDGFTRPEMTAREPDFFARRAADHWRFVPPDGESYAMTADRLTAWLREQDGRRTLAVVTHGASARILRGLYAGLSPDEIFALDEPQDAVFRLHKGNVQRIETGL
jgi:broad specificity phosphatase PhoE